MQSKARVLGLVMVEMAMKYNRLVVSAGGSIVRIVSIHTSTNMHANRCM